mmetsp:Transcript_5232/g.8059  ORF Transcript_5232/g.8059 Transcript_5232/m.8059 type:complete len:225 (+) Transcript_5232:2-676(+)
MNPTTESIQTASNPQPSEDIWVYVWNLTSDGVGHTGIQVGDTYMSIHPGRVPAVGPTIVFPLPAILASKLTDDMESEAAASRKDTVDPDSFYCGVASDTPLDQKAPDRIYRVAGLDTAAMRKTMRQVEAGVESDNISYQLVPRINALSFFKELPAYLSQDPVDMTLTREQPSQKQRGAVYNCATLVDHLLQAGGMRPVPHSRIPWEPTPNAIADHVEESGFRPT